MRKESRSASNDINDIDDDDDDDKGGGGGSFFLRSREVELEDGGFILFVFSLGVDLLMDR